MKTDTLQDLLLDSKSYQTFEEWLDSWEFVRRSNSTTGENDVGWQMFTNNPEAINSYGKNRFFANDSNAVSSDSLLDEIEAVFENHPEILESYQVSAYDLAQCASPNNIVDSAALWDSIELTECIWFDLLEPKNILKVETLDGLIVFDNELVYSEAKLKELWDSAHKTASNYSLMSYDASDNIKTQKTMFDPKTRHFRKELQDTETDPNTVTAKKTVFLGGECQTDWRDDVIKALKGIEDLGFIDPVDENWKAEENIYTELEDMLNSDEVVFFNGGDGTKKEKKFLDGLNRDYEEFSEIKKLISYLQQLVEDDARASDSQNTDEIYSHGALMAAVPEDLSTTILKRIVPEIPIKNLRTEEQTHGIETESHITVLYGAGDDLSFEQTKDIIQKCFKKPLKLKSAEDIDYFEHEDGNVAIIRIESEDLHQLRQELEKNGLKNASEFKAYNPHITIAYLKPDTEIKDLKSPLKSYEWELSYLILSMPDGHQELIYIAGEEPDKDYLNVLSALNFSTTHDYV